MKTEWLNNATSQEVELADFTPTPNSTIKVERNVKPKKQVQGTGKLSSTPWVQITGHDIDEQKGIRVALDWNDAFIRYLQQNGITGSNEDEIVRKYIAMLYRDISKQMENTSEYE